MSDNTIPVSQSGPELSGRSLVIGLFVAMIIGSAYPVLRLEARLRTEPLRGVGVPRFHDARAARRPAPPDRHERARKQHRADDGHERRANSVHVCLAGRF